MFGFDDRTRALLVALARVGNVAAAAHAVGMDASNARRHLALASSRAGAPLVASRRGGSDGRNSTLTASGRRLLGARGLRGVALAYDREAGVTPVRVGRRVVLAAGRHGSGPVELDVPPESVALRRPGPSPGGSVRNEIPMRVEGLHEAAEGTWTVDLSSGSLRLRALVTRGAARELRLRKGSRVVAAIKAVAVRVLTA